MINFHESFMLIKSCKIISINIRILKQERVSPYRIFNLSGPKFLNAFPGKLKEKPSLFGEKKNALKRFLLQTNRNS